MNLNCNVRDIFSYFDKLICSSTVKYLFLILLHIIFQNLRHIREEQICWYISTCVKLSKFIYSKGDTTDIILKLLLL